MKFEYKAILVLVAMIIVIVTLFSINTRVVNRRYNDLQNKIYQMQLEHDTLSASTKATIIALQEVTAYMDSIYYLTQQSNESNIRHYWDSIYNNLVNVNPNPDFLAEYLRQIAEHKQ
jgi:ABC-type uncharacterized transport system permease subunit